MTQNGYIPVSHVLPVYPAAQAQEYALILSVHVPPFLQGPGAHSSISLKIKILHRLKREAIFIRHFYPTLHIGR
jgi:hypothetical protein